MVRLWFRVSAILTLGMAVMPAPGQSMCPPQAQWQGVFGSSGYEEATDIRQMPDGGFVVGGVSGYWGTGGNKTATNYGALDFWVVRLDANGNKLWDQSYGGSQGDELAALELASDGGFVLGGSSFSGQGDGNKTGTNYGWADFWLVQTDASGVKLWDLSLGGSHYDVLESFQQTSDGGYILLGGSLSPPDGVKTSGQFGSDDFWVVRLDANRNILWDRSFGGSRQDWPESVVQSADGGFVLVGRSDSGIQGNKTSPYYGGYDYWIVRLDANGNKLWDRSYGGTFNDWPHSVVETSDAGFIVAGWSESQAGGNKTTGSYGGRDMWVVRLDANGDKLWERAYGGADMDGAYGLSHTSDRGFVLAGWSSSTPSGSKTSAHYGDYDYWMVRIDQEGNQLWDESFGGSLFDRAKMARQTSDNGYVIGGMRLFDDDPTDEVFGHYEMVVFKLAAENPTDCDNDGVPNSHDQCPATAAGQIVNSAGCSIEQICLCDEYGTHGEYVDCVRSASAQFHGEGLITGAQRHGLVERAKAANCPPIPDPLVVFGLVHQPIGNPKVALAGEFRDVLFIEDPRTGAPYGVSISLGEADSGLFIYPSGPWGEYGESWFLDGKAYGRLRGEGNDALVSSVRVTKPYYETYPVHIDFSPLNPESLTFQVFSNRTSVAQATTAGASGSLTVISTAHLAPRGNPFWRLPDGSIAVLIELTGDEVFSDAYNNPLSISGPFGEDVRGNRIVVRANGATRQVDYVSRMDVVAGGGVYFLEILDERLGMFNHAHKALGSVLLNASNGRLEVTGASSGENNDGGVLIETVERASRLEVDLLPVEFHANSLLRIFAGGAVDESAPYVFARMEVGSAEGHLLLLCDFGYLYGEDEGQSGSPPLLEAKVFRNGTLTGTATYSAGLATGTLHSKNNHLPAIVGTAAFTDSNGVAAVSISFDRIITFAAADGALLRGDHIRISAVNAAPRVRTISQIALQVTELPLTITGERSDMVPPALNINASSASGAAILSWGDNTRLYTLESAASLAGPFTELTNEVDFVENKNSVTISLGQTVTQFFRLRRAME